MRLLVTKDEREPRFCPVRIEPIGCMLNGRHRQQERLERESGKHKEYD
jgi:hypothetical protein